MPGKNILKIDIDDSFHHVYSRGVNKMHIFHDQSDYRVFKQLLHRYLGDQVVSRPFNNPYPNFYDTVKLACYCLMPNHIHLLVYQQEASYMAKFMRALLAAYARHFNQKYDRSGPVFESRYRASYIDSVEYLEYVSKYIHRNPERWKEYKHSSYALYSNKHAPVSWLKPKLVLNGFSSNREYLEFVSTDMDEDIL